MVVLILADAGMDADAATARVKRELRLA